MITTIFSSRVKPDGGDNIAVSKFTFRDGSCSPSSTAAYLSWLWLKAVIAYVFLAVSFIFITRQLVTDKLLDSKIYGLLTTGADEKALETLTTVWLFE